ncbi:MAG TPA: SGNH/GDSL hydrolase family protein [Galbitalea sp.]|nr:SGNH/GDSL hydrolase family protein [Galbitalea sp.]
MELPEGSEYVALGGSYAAGPGIGDRVPESPRLASRSTHNYAHLLAAKLKLRLTDVSFSGATVAQILGRERGTAAPQLESVTADTRLVTLTGGGNDLGYIGYLVLASLPWLVRAVTGSSVRFAAMVDEAEFERKSAALGDDLIALFDAIRARAPRATIAVTDYLSLLPPDAAVNAHPLRRDAADRGRMYWTRVNLILRQAAARAGAVFAEVSAASADRHAWSASPWTERFVLVGGKAAAYHPTRDGMAFVANALEGALRNA